MIAPDVIAPAVGLPLAAILILAWWLVERRAHKLGTGAAGAVLGSAHASVPAGSRPTNHEVGRHEPWCHAVAGCSSPGHCTCDADMIREVGGRDA